MRKMEHSFSHLYVTEVDDITLKSLFEINQLLGIQLLYHLTYCRVLRTNESHKPLSRQYWKQEQNYTTR